MTIYRLCADAKEAQKAAAVVSDAARDFSQILCDIEKVTRAFDMREVDTADFSAAVFSCVPADIAGIMRYVSTRRNELSFTFNWYVLDRTEIHARTHITALDIFEVLPPLEFHVRTDEPFDHCEFTSKMRLLRAKLARQAFIWTDAAKYFDTYANTIEEADEYIRDKFKSLNPLFVHDEMRNFCSDESVWSQTYTNFIKNNKCYER